MPKNKWYTRRGYEVRGPFSVSEIQRLVLLGRLKPQDYVSIDQCTWQSLGLKPDLIPEELKLDLNDSENQARLQAARQAQDERSSRERREQDRPINTTQRTGLERREEKSPHPSGFHALLVNFLRHPREHSFFYMVFSGFLIGCVAMLSVFVVMHTTDQNNDCFVPAGPGVNWSHCVFEALPLPKHDLTGAILNYGIFRNANMQDAILYNANMSYSNFSGADFTRANLSKAQFEGAVLQLTDFSGADLSGANLSHSILKDANLEEANLTGADLSGAVLIGATINAATLEGVNLSAAIWVDSTICGPNSIGQCESQ